MTTERRGHTAHRASYTLERGVWHATCQSCGHTVSDMNRRRAAATFRIHIREVAASDATLRIDLTGTDLAPPFTKEPAPTN